jgi:hypothetical protein
VLERRGERGITYAIRFRAYGRREYLTVGGEWEGVTRERAKEELDNVLADVRRGIWVPDAGPAEPPPKPATFGSFAVEWFELKRLEGLAPRTLEDYEHSLNAHLMPFFRDHRLSDITAREVDQYKATKKREGVLAPRTINKTLTRLAQILEVAVEYEMIQGNPARGSNRRLATKKPRRAFVSPEQLPALLAASEGLLKGRAGRSWRRSPGRACGSARRSSCVSATSTSLAASSRSVPRRRRRACGRSI